MGVWGVTPPHTRFCSTPSALLSEAFLCPTPGTVLLATGKPCRRQDDSPGLTVWGSGPEGAQ